MAKISPLILAITLSLPIWSQAVPTPPAPVIPVGLPPDVVKAIQTALANAASPAPVPAAGPSNSPAPASLPDIPALAPTMLPKTIITAGGGYSSPGGTFAYASFSTLTLPQQTYVTGAIEYTLVKGQIQTCTLAGLTKPLYQFWYVTFGLTGLGGGCMSTSGSSSPIGSGQPFLYFRFGKLPFGAVVAGTKNTDGSGWKVTLGLGPAKD